MFVSCRKEKWTPRFVCACGLGFDCDSPHLFISIINNNNNDTKKSMEDETSRLVDKVQELGDIELAALLCLIAQEHCIIEADEEELENVEQELKLVSGRRRAIILVFNINAPQIANNTFGLSYAVVDCSKDTTVDDFGSSILIEGDDEGVITPVPKLPTFQRGEVCCSFLSAML